MEIMIYKKKHRKETVKYREQILNNYFLYKIIAIYPGFKIKYRRKTAEEEMFLHPVLFQRRKR